MWGWKWRIDIMHIFNGCNVVFTDVHSAPPLLFPCGDTNEYSFFQGIEFEKDQGHFSRKWSFPKVDWLYGPWSSFFSPCQCQSRRNWNPPLWCYFHDDHAGAKIFPKPLIFHPYSFFPTEAHRKQKNWGIYLIEKGTRLCI